MTDTNETVVDETADSRETLGAAVQDAVEADTLDGELAAAGEDTLASDETLEGEAVDTDALEIEQDAASVDEPETAQDAASGDDAEDTEPQKGDDAISAELPEVETIEAGSEDVDQENVSDTVEAGNQDVPDLDTPPEPAAQSDATSAPLPVVAQPQRRGSMWPAVFGGVIAALLGFIAGRGDQLEQYLPQSIQRQATDLTAIEEETAALVAQTAEQAERIAALEAQEIPEIPEMPEVPDLSGELADVNAAIADLNASISELAGRVEQLEARPIATVNEDSASSEDLAQLQAALDNQRAEIEALAARAEEAEANAAAEASRILARAALTRVVTAVESGEAYAPALGDLEQVAPVEVPNALRDSAERGVPTLTSLRESFPDAARAGLAAARENIPEFEVEGITGFLKRQLSARSITPREGDDPDAILSRAEAAVRAGDLETALAEMDGLPEIARSAMSEWLDAAMARKAAQDAAEQLADSLNSN